MICTGRKHTNLQKRQVPQNKSQSINQVEIPQHVVRYLAIKFYFLDLDFNHF